MEMLVDSFAGGGGASTGIRMAMGREVDIAINHDPEAISLHTVNHPNAIHYCESVYKVDPVEATGGRPVGLFWASPDCRHFSKAKGGAPTSPRVRGLAWVVIKWAKRVAPRVIMLENVEEFSGWGPLGIDGRPCEARMGMTYRLWTNQLRGMGYQVESRVLRACDYGAPTSRKRLFVIARRDGQPIVWPMPTHGPGTGQPWRTAAECIDWSIEVPSIFGRDKPLADNTLARIAEGIRRYVVECADPFIVRIGQTGGGGHYTKPLDAPITTVTTKAEHCLVVPTLVQTGYGERPGQAPRVPGLDKPLGTVVAGGQKHALVAAFLSQNNTGMVGHDCREPMSTIVGKGSTQSPITVSLGSPDDHREDVTAFLIRFYSSGGQWSRITDPTPTITTRDRMGLVTVHGREYRIVDIGLRMLTPRELYRAQGFPEDYQIDVTHEGKRLSKAAQVRMCGNSVSPPIAAALVGANLGQQRQRVAA
jgi:DNA (cytosine-5)-methyltransferase 1